MKGNERGMDGGRGGGETEKGKRRWDYCQDVIYDKRIFKKLKGQSWMLTNWKIWVYPIDIE